MTKDRSLRQRLISAALVLVMLVSSLLGATFAWFTDNVTSEGNKIESGSLKIDLLHKTGEDSWVSLKDEPQHKVFAYDNWEPGFTTVDTLKVKNLGSLALQYKLSVEVATGTAELGKNGENLADVIDVYVADGNVTAASYTDIQTSADWTHKGTLSEVMAAPADFIGGTLVADADADVTIALHMQESAGNEYQKLSVGNIYVNLIATQWGSESDSFDNTYDEGALFPNLNIGGLEIPVQTENGLTTAETTAQGTGVRAKIPAGVSVNGTTLNLSVVEMQDSQSNVTLADGEALRALDVHMAGVSENNTVPMLITIEQAMTVGLNIGNYTLYHVEDGTSVAMTSVGTLDELDAHNEFYYDPATGDVTLAMATFSEVAFVAEQSVWKGGVDHTWYDASKADLVIANADQLWSFSQIVGGMARDEHGNFLITYTDSDGDAHHNDTFFGKTVKLIADINLGDKESENNSDLIFYPIGYWNSDETYEKTGHAVSSGFYTFQGTFDGNGNTISNIYQNTWEMKGDHDWYDASLQYYRDGMGLFGRVLGGTIKNLTVDNFSCDSEIGTTGVIAAYADSKDGQPAIFENITITNCNPRVYNIGNGGIVGCAGWYSRNNSLGNAGYTNAVTFRNITVDQTNKISALWGSWGVSCAGILGQYYPDSNCGIKLENCHVAAIIDVNNDVCSNYQYYWYRYAGMFIGTIRSNTTDENGYTVADTTGVFAENCTYTMGNWNEYWYCEIVANSLASYTHDHQFSRLDNIYNLSEIQDGNGNWNKEGHFALLDANRDIVDCYHIFKDSNGNLYRHFHDVADESNPNIYESFDLNGDGELNDLKEDRQRYFIPFNQLLTGLDMGIKAHTAFEGITHVDGTVKSEEKFTANKNVQVEENAKLSIGAIFTASGKGTIASPTVQVYVSPVGDESTVSAVYAGDVADWFNGTLTFSGTGSAKITITDYFYCTPTTIIVDVAEHQHVYENACDTTCNTCGGVREITHTYTPAVTAPTCTEAGYTTYTCSCGDSYVVDETDALGHSYNTVVTAPTCTTGGYTTYTCSKCNHSYVGTEVAALGHKYTAVITPPTCTTGGYTTYTCSCGDSYVADLVEKLDHTYTPVVTAPTCTTDGYTTHTCTCGDTYTDNEVAALGHIECKFTGDFLYRVGNQNAVELSSLFNVGKRSVTVTGANVPGGASVTVSGTSLKFNGTGVVKITLTSDCTCGECDLELTLEVVDATNVTGLSGTISGNVVLLNDCGLSSLTVSGRNTVYGNGFTATYTGNGQYLNNGLKQGLVTVSENGTLDNLRIVAPVYPRAYMYYGSTVLGDYVQGGPSSVEGDKTRYHYQLSGVVAKGNATISNCYIYGGRTNIFVDTGDVTIKDTILECGTVANVQIQSNSSHTITLENVTTIQYQVNPTYGSDEDKNKVMLGAGVLVGPETKDNPKIVLNGYFKQYNWVTDDDKKVVSDNAVKKIIEGALNAIAFNHTVNGKTSSNLGIIYMNEFAVNVENNTGLPYELADVSISSANGQAYSLQNASADQIYSDYEHANKSTVNGFYQPQFKYDATLGGQYIEKDSGDEHLYREGDTINVMFPSGDTKELDLAALVNINKYTGQHLNLVITCKDENGNSVRVTDGKITLSVAGKYIVTYTVTDTVFFGKDGETIDKSIEYSWNVTIDVSLKDTAVPDAYYTFDTSKQKMGYEVKSNIFSTSVYQYIPFLAGLKIYDYNGQTSYLRFDGDSDFNKVSSITVTNKYSGNDALVVVKLTDGGVITLQLLARADSGGGSTYTGSIKTRDNVIYFVNDGTTSDKDTTTTAAYWYVDYYKFTGNNGVEITSAQQRFSSTGSSKSTPSGNFSTTIKSTVTYDANGGNCGQITGYATSASTAVTLPTPTRSGYIFAGWFTAASGGTRVGGAGDSYTPTANITLYAQWGKPCDVTYNANGGSCGTASEKYSGTALTLPTPTRDGYWFIGWYDAAEGGNKIGDAGATYNPSGEITLYAHWQEKIEYTVTYNSNGGTCNTASATYQGTALTLPTPTRTGYKFKGWYTAASGGTKIGDAGASYTPSANITLYAQWQINSYTIKVTTNNATVKVNGTVVQNNGTVSIQYGAQVTVEVTYSESNERSTTIQGTDGTTYTSPFTMPAQNVTINATSSGCVTPDTLVTLADGTQVRVDSLTGNEELLVWNLETGKLDKAPIMFVDSDAEAEYEIIKLYFSDGTEVKIIYEHGFWDYDLNKYVYLDKNAAEYIGHTFAKQNGDALEKVQLVDVVIETATTTAWSPVTAGHLCYFVNGMLSMPGGVGGLFNIFEVDAETMTYDYEQMAKDIETYGLYTYEELNAICPLSEDMFNAAGGAYLKISIGKGNLTEEELFAMITRYSKFFN